MKEYQSLYNTLLQLNELTKLKLITQRLANAESKVVSELQKYIKSKPIEVLNKFIIQVDLKSEEELSELTQNLNSKGLKCISKYTPHYYATDRDELDFPEKYEIIIQC